MSRILLLSNGHGEDLSGSLLAKELLKNGHVVDALPIVGKGIHYKKENINVIGRTKVFLTGGIGYTSLKGRLFEIFEGQIIYFLQKLYLSYKLRRNYDFYLVVGDIVPVFFAWVAKKEFFTYLVAYSSHYEGKLKLPWPCQYFLKSRNSKKIYTRDLLTAIDLTKQLGKRISFLGNPFMDKFSSFDNKLKIFSLSLGLFPGSRFPEMLDNLILMIELLEAMSNLIYFQKIEFNFAIVNSLSALKIEQILNERKWKLLEKMGKNQMIKFQYKFINVNFYWNSFEQVMLKSTFVISMAGTATEQAIGLAKPVIQIEGKGPQFTKSFADAQRRLLGEYVFCATKYKNKKDQISQTINLVIKVLYFIKLNKNYMSLCIDNAKQRLGEENACIRMVEDLINCHKNV